MVTVEVPASVPAVVTVIVDVPEPVTEAGLNEAVAPAGNPLAVKLTAPVNPFSGLIFTVYAAVPPEFVDAVVGGANGGAEGLHG